MAIVEYAKKGLAFVRRYPGILSSLVLLVVVPLTLYLNIQYTVNKFTANIDEIVKRQVFIIEQVLGSSLDGDLQKDRVDRVARRIIDENEDVMMLEVVRRNDAGFEPVVSVARQDKQPSEATRKMFDELSAQIWQSQKTDAFGFKSFEGGIPQWNIVEPFYDKDHVRVGLVRMSFSIGVADALAQEAIRNTYYILIIAVLLVVVLIVNHTRLFEYSVLFGKLQEVDKMKDEFISMAAHELKTPVVVMKGYAELLQSNADKFTEEQKKERLKAIVSYADNLMTLITDILDVSRIEQGRMVLDMQKRSPYPTVKDVADTIKVKADEKGLIFTYDDKEAAEPAMVMMDDKRLRQVLINLVGNSIKYTEQGKVQVATKADKIRKRFTIVVEDTGLGMSAEAQKNLFQKFYRVKTDRTEHISGTGLGLWITKALCENMGGEIFVESMEGVGSKFTVTFPLVIEDIQRPAGVA